VGGGAAAKVVESREKDNEDMPNDLVVAVAVAVVTVFVVVAVEVTMIPSEDYEKRRIHRRQ